MNRREARATWIVGHAALAGISVRAVTVMGSLAAATFAAVVAVGGLAKSPAWTVAVWCSVATALILAAVVGLSRRALSRRGASIFVIVADAAIATCVAAFADPLLGTVCAGGVLAILGNFAVFYTPSRVFVAHLFIAATVTGLVVARLRWQAGDVLVGVIAAWLAVGMQPLTRRLWDDMSSTAAVAFLDPLTGTVNRAGLERNVGYLRAEVSRGRQSLAVVVVDLDRFKQVNDSFGHAVGDAVLVEAAHHLFRHFGPAATVSRSGGEEFVVVIDGPRAEVTRRIHALPPATPGHTAPVVGMSIGAAWCSLAAEGGLDVAIGRADIAMYAAKRAGGRCVYSEL